MRKIYIIAALMIAAALYLLTTAAGDISQYTSLSQAALSGDRVKVVGQLDKSQPVEYDPQTDPNRLSFYLRDNEGVTKKVVLLQAKPQDFEMSEQIVLTGRMKGEEFVATEVLLKCPSKYKDEELYLKRQQGQNS
jgi:cytochrome c-type biogenesis protein CcmE